MSKKLRRIASANLHLIREIRENRTHLLLRKNCSYFADGMATANWSEFLNEPRFDKAFLKGWDGVKASSIGEQRFPQTKWRAHIVAWAFNQTKTLPGDLIECGTWYGTLMLTACHYTGFQNWNKRLFLADTWGPNSVTPTYSKYQIDIFQEVQKRFSSFPNVHFIRGELPESLEKIEDSVTSISFLSLDLNDGPTERKLLERLWKKLDSGAIVYLDDYGGRAFPQVRQEIDEFLKGKSETLLHFPNQVSILIKH
jgi:O-methyltransferase